jgi:hypothetical protein
MKTTDATAKVTYRFVSFISRRISLQTPRFVSIEEHHPPPGAARCCARRSCCLHPPLCPEVLLPFTRRRREPGSTGSVPAKLPPRPHPPLRRLSPLNPLCRRASPSPRCHFSEVALLHLLVWRRRLAKPTPQTNSVHSWSGGRPPSASGIPQNLLEKVILALNSNPYPPSPSAVVGVRGEERRCDTAERQGRPGRAQPTKWESKR